MRAAGCTVENVNDWPSKYNMYLADVLPPEKLFLLVRTCSGGKKMHGNLAQTIMHLVLGIVSKCWAHV